MNIARTLQRVITLVGLGAAGVAGLVITISLATSGRALAQRAAAECVRICNTEAEPIFFKAVGIVPVRGDVRVNGGNVAINSSPESPVYMKATTKVLTPSDIFDRNIDARKSPELQELRGVVITVPQGKALSLEHVEADEDGIVIGTLEILKNNVRVALVPELPAGIGFFGPFSAWSHTSGGPLTFAHAGDVVEFRFSSDAGGLLHLHFSGQFFDAP